MFYDNLKAECDRQGLKLTPTVIECGGKAGSIGGWKKGAAPNSDIVMKIAKRLNVSTDYLLFGNQNESLNDQEKEIIRAYRSVNEEGKERIIEQVEFFSNNPQYKKYTDIPKNA